MERALRVEYCEWYSGEAASGAEVHNCCAVGKIPEELRYGERGAGRGAHRDCRCLPAR